MLISSLILAWPSFHATAWPAARYTDAELVERAELIVVGRVKENSIARIAHKGSYEHRAVILISRVLKGKVKGLEVPIIMHYGILPVPAQYENELNSDKFVGTPEMPPYNSQEPIRVYEDNPSEGIYNPTGDIRNDQIWMLRLHSVPGARDYPDIATTDAPGVWDPQDIQPLSKEKALAIIISAGQPK